MKTLSERVNKKLMSGYKPTDEAKRMVGVVSDERFNTLMCIAVRKYNETHLDKIFN